MRKLIKWMNTLVIMIMILFAANTQDVQAASNPYPTTQDVDGDGNYEVPCTRFAWQQVYDNQGIALPAWGNAVNWWQSAKNAGYATGSEPRAGAIAVWSGDTYGHVAYVTSGSGNTFTVNEGGRTDLDHTSSHGVKYGYTLTNAVGGRRPYDSGKILLGFIYPNGQSSMQNPWIEVRDVTETSSTEAKLNAYIRNPGGVYITTVGCYIWDANGNLIKEHYEEINSQSHTRDGVEMWFYMNRELGIQIQANTKYRYQMCAIFNNGGSTVYTGVCEYSTIPPKWYSGLTPVNLNNGAEVYASIIKNKDWVHLGNVNGNVQVTKNGIEDGSDVWHFIRQGDGSYAILNCLDNKALTVSNGGQTDRTNIILSTWKGAEYQKWYIYGRWSGEYVLRPKHTDKVLDICDDSGAIGTNVQLFTYGSNNTAQKLAIWSFDKVGKSTLSANAGNSSVKTKLSWTAAKGANKYKIKINKGSKGKVTEYKNINAGNKTAYELILPEGYYEATVYSCNRFSQETGNTVSFTVKKSNSSATVNSSTDKKSVASKEKTSSIVSKSRVSVKRPTGLKVRNIRKKKVKLTWKKAKNVNGYEIYRSTKKNGKYRKIKTIKKNSITGYINVKLKGRQQYYYKVRSYKMVGKRKYYSSFTEVEKVKVKR